MEPKYREKSDLTLMESLSLGGKCQALLSRINNVNFDDLLQLAKDAGFLIKKPDGTSHHLGKHPTHSGGPPAFDKMNFQEVKGKAKPYQIRQLVDFLRNAQKKEGKK